MALYRRKKVRRTRRSRRRYTSDYRRRRSSVIRKIVVAVIIGIALFALGFFVIEPWLDGLLSPAETADVTPAPTSEPVVVSTPTPTPTPEPTPTPTPVSLGVSLSVEELTDPTLRAAVLAEAVADGADTVFLPLKAEDGRLYYVSSVEKAVRIGAAAENAVDLPSVLTEVREAGLKAAASFVVFDEPFTADAIRDAAVKYNNSETRWLNSENEFSQDPGLEAAQEYELSLLEELSGYDFSVIRLSGCHYPVWGSLFGCTPDSTLSREENITGFLTSVHEKLSAKGILLDVTIPADVAVGDRHSRAELYGYPEDLSALPCDSLSVDLRLDRVLTRYYTAITVDGVAYSDLLSDPEASLRILYGAAYVRQEGIGVLLADNTRADKVKEWGASLILYVK